MRIENITPALAEKARACDTADKLSAFIADEGIELTDEQMAAVTGGTNFVQGFKRVLGPFLYPLCPQGGRHEFEDFYQEGSDEFDHVRCVKCGTIY